MAQDSRSTLQAHHQTYSGFIRLLKIGGVISFAVAALVVLVIAS